MQTKTRRMHTRMSIDFHAESSYVIATNGCTSSPDNPLGFNFKPCCDLHDICYQTCAAKRNVCDDKFLKCLQLVCSIHAGLTRSICLGLAAVYHQAVVDHGVDPYNSSQYEACLWAPCTRPPTQTRRYIGSSDKGTCPYFCPNCPTGKPLDTVVF
jgi:hypothetical protein